MKLAFAVSAALLLHACGGGATAPDAAPDDEIDAAAPDAMPNDNVSLSAMTVSAGALSPPFEPSVAEYDLDLIVGEASLMIAATAAVPAGATITVDGVAAVSGEDSVDLAPSLGSRDIDVVVTATSGATSTYRVHVRRGVDGLASLVPTTGTLIPAFTPPVAAYGLGLPLATSSVAWTPTLLFPDRASLTFNGAAHASGTATTSTTLITGDNPMTFVVTPSSRPARTYPVTVRRGSDTLTGLSLAYLGQPMSNAVAPAFAPTTAGYAAGVGHWMYRVQVRATRLDPDATVTVAGGAVPFGADSATISLNPGLTTVSIVVTAPQGTARTYALDLTKAATVVEQAHAYASAPDANDHFGGSVAIWGETVIVGAADEDSAAFGVGGNATDDSSLESGAAYVLQRTGAAWTQQAYLKASTNGTFDRFGSAVAISGDTIVVSAVDEDSSAVGVGGNQASNDAFSSGAVYVFTRTAGVWTQQAYLKASNTAGTDNFGAAVAISGDTLVVGAPGEDSAATGVGGDQKSDAASGSGAVYVFRRTAGVWAQEAYVKASNPTAADGFGQAVAINGDTIVVGAKGEDSAAIGVGGNQADETASGSGAAYVFTRAGTTWTQQGYLKATNTEAGDAFGTSVSISVDMIVVGAPDEDGAGTNTNGDQASNAASSSGAAYAFRRTGTTWVAAGYLKASNTDASDAFGTSVSLWGEQLIVGATREDSSSTGVEAVPNELGSSNGAGYVFTYPNSSWSAVQFIKASARADQGRMGGSVAQWGDTFVLGSANESAGGGGVNVYR